MTPKVVSKEIAQRLKEAGYPQESCWWWRFAKSIKKPELLQYSTLRPTDGEETWHGKYTWHKTKYFAAPSAEEILEKLPKEIFEDREFWELQIKKGEDIRKYYLVRYVKREMEALSCNLNVDKFLSNALAKMYCSLKQKGALT